ncbi:MAG: hypothetical protein ACE5I3_04325 [Phycisphaerae bacterium]
MRRRSRTRRVLKWAAAVVCLVLVAACGPWSLFYGTGPWWVDVGTAYVELCVFWELSGTEGLLWWFDGTYNLKALLPRGERDPIRTRIAIPIWPLLAVAATMTVLLFRSDRRFPPGKCQNCGYDLTGNLSGRCPECGAQAEPISPQRRRFSARLWALLVGIWLVGLGSYRVAEGVEALTGSSTAAFLAVVGLWLIVGAAFGFLGALNRSRWITILAPLAMGAGAHIAFCVECVLEGVRPHVGILGWTVVGLLACWAVLVHATTEAVIKRRSAPVHCQKCGYDLTGNVSGCCPECGELV